MVHETSLGGPDGVQYTLRVLLYTSSCNRCEPHGHSDGHPAFREQANSLHQVTREDTQKTNDTVTLRARAICAILLLRLCRCDRNAARVTNKLNQMLPHIIHCSLRQEILTTHTCECNQPPVRRRAPTAGLLLACVLEWHAPATKTNGPHHPIPHIPATHVDRWRHALFKPIPRPRRALRCRLFMSYAPSRPKSESTSKLKSESHSSPAARATQPTGGRARSPPPRRGRRTPSRGCARGRSPARP